MLTDAELLSLEKAGLIDAAKRAEIDAFLKNTRTGDRAGGAVDVTPRFDLTHILWYAGALIIMGAMGLFTNEAFNRMGGWALAACGTAYLLAFFVAGHFLWRNRALRIPAGLLIAVAVSMVPLIIFGVQDATGAWTNAYGRAGDFKDFFSYINGSWIFMEIATIIAAGVAVWFYRFPFILLIAGIALWFMSMDLAVWFMRTEIGDYDWTVRREVSMYFGVAMIVAAWAIDLMREDGPDFPFWIHIFGVMTFWGAMTLNDGGTELQKFLYCLICIGLIGLSVFLNRRVYAVFGALGVAFYLGYLANEVFKDVILFSFALSGIGLAVIFLGLTLHRNRARMMAAMDRMMPENLRWLRPAHARVAG